ncbi:twinfilin-2-A [Aplysia californica]|uniref:Twinfilin-2-A n=1 Tax=Aplysia californica TaxID=6500 RepID=A0ABM0JF36_APLCA|nr:twinfilin-2-A [Aplysia californica]
MSHQTGITANSELRTFLASSKDGSVRLIKVAIEDEELVYADSSAPNGSWEDDYDALVLPLLDEKMPCFILYRFDSQNSAGYEWLFISWSPDFAAVRQKMLYAATRATMKSQFGGGQIKDELFGTVVSDVNLSGYRKHVQAAQAPAPLTMAEEELKLIKQNEVNAHIHVETKSQTMQGVAFPLTPDAENAVVTFRDGAINYVQLCLDLEKEVVEAASSDTIRVNQLISRVPTESARYHMFRFSHTHEGDAMDSVVFIYSMPGYKCSIRERMLYSSCKAPLCDQLAAAGIEIEKKIEVDDPSELTEEFIYDEIHPKKNVARQAFAKPKGPAGRGPKRMTRPKE